MSFLPSEEVLTQKQSFKLLEKVPPRPDLEVWTVISLFIPIPASVWNTKNKLLSIKVEMRCLHSWSMQLAAFWLTEMILIDLKIQNTKKVISRMLLNKALNC